MAGLKVAKKALKELGYKVFQRRDGGVDVHLNDGSFVKSFASPNDAVKSMSSLSRAVDDYRGSHKAPTYEEGVKNLAYNMEDVYPRDVYQPSLAAQYYGHGDKRMDLESLRELARVQGNPDADMTVYRAVPKGVSDINEGDWVTLSQTYAKQHGEGPLGGDYDVISKKVKAKDVVGSGDSIHEYGYSPSSIAYNIGGIAPVAGLGALAGQSNESQAMPYNPMSAMSRPYTAMERLAVGYPQEAIPAKFPVLGQAASLIGNRQDPTGMLFDTSGLSEYLNRFGEGGTFGQRLGRAFGAMPF